MICLSYYIVCQVISLLLSMIKRKRIQVKDFNSYKRVWANLSPLLIPIINYSGYCSERKGRPKFQGVPISNCERLALLLASLIKPKRIQVKGFNSFEIVWANLSPLLILIINYSRYLQQDVRGDQNFRLLQFESQIARDCDLNSYLNPVK